MNRIHDSLRHVFQRHRLVFWYDPEGQWTPEFETFKDDGIHKRRIEGTEWGTKVAIHRDPDPQARYLLYFPSARPPDADNWLLDLLLQGHEYQADRASLALQAVGLPYEFLPVVAQHIAFFHSTQRAQAFQKLLAPEEDAARLRLKMMAVLAGTAPDLDALLLRFLDQASTLSRCLQPPLPLEGGDGWGEGVISSDPVEECLGPARLAEPFWQMVGHAFAYRSEHPTLRDFAATLFRWANPLDAGVTLDPHAQVFLKRWQDSATHGPSFRAWAGLMEAELHVTAQLETLDDPKRIEAADTFPAFEKFFIHRLCRAFEAGATSPDLLPTLQQRRNSFWYPHHAGGYRALEQAIALRDGINAADLTLDSLDAGLARYVTAWHRIDTAYRRFCHHLRRYNQVALMERIAEWVEKTYVNSFLLPLADRWSDQVRGLTRWGCQQLPPQTAFFARFVQPYLDKGQKVVVVVSDALRFEAAADFAARLRAENRWTAEVHAMLGVLPSYTQLGMAALLPGQERRIQLPEGTVAVDGKSTAGTAARQQILATALNGRATALQTEAFMDLNTKTGARALLRDHEVVYLFHNRIDKVGDALATEAKTADAVEEAFEELLNLLRKIANANGNHMLLTADHGFLFQQSAVAEEDDQLLPEAGEWLFRNRRFALGRGIVPHPAAKIFSAPELGLPGDWSAAFPLALGRFPLQGSGKRYVHGGPSLQEVVVPVIRIHKARTDDIGRVEVEFLRLPARITTGQLALALYQDRPVADKVLGRTLRLGVYAADGTALSEARTLTFDSADAEPRNREQNVTLTLARAADRYNHQEVEIRLEETLAGTRQTAVYKSHRVKLHKPFASDFDDF